MVIVSDDFVVIGSWFQIYNSRSSNIRSKATSPSCSSSSLRVKMTKWACKNSWSTVWCLRHQPWNTRGFFSKLNKAAILHYLLDDMTPEDVSYSMAALFIQDRTTLLHNPTNLPLTYGSWSDGGQEALLVLDWQSPSSLSKPWRGWGVGVQRI